MKYTILSINDERAHRKADIRRAMASFEEIFVECVDGKNEEQLNANIDRYGFTNAMSRWRPGEGGVWYSNINAWQWAVDNNEELMVFEDDAIPLPKFTRTVKGMELPEDYDFITFYIPYVENNTIMPIKWVPTYQEHGCVCMLYSPKGAKRILELLAENGLEWPVDIWVFKQALFHGQLKGYSPAQFSHRIMTHDFKIKTNIHEDERIDVHQPERNE